MKPAAIVDDAIVTSPRNCVVAYEPRYWSEVIELARSMREESGFHRRITFDEEKLAVQLLIASKRDDHYFRLCVNKHDHVLGGFLGFVSSVFFSPELVAQDMAWYVHPEYRATNAALLLVKDFEQWARARGASHFMLSQATGNNIDSMKALYEKLGYRVVGVNSVKGI